MMPEYKLINTEPAHLSGPLLDNVYVGKHIFQKCYLKTMQKVSAYFSDNETVKFKLGFL